MAQKLKSVLITGASGGIGYELSRLFAKDGYRIVMVARSMKKLKEKAISLQKEFNSDVITIGSDLSEPRSAENVYKKLKHKSVNIDVLVNNAGIGVFGHFSQTDAKSELQMMQLNMVSLTELTKLFLPDMIKRREGKILNVASTAAFQPGPKMAVYYASKAYVLSFSEAISNELNGTGVSVTALCPGPTRTAFFGKADMEKSILASKLFTMDVKKVADSGYKGLMKGRRMVVPGINNKLFYILVRLVPRNITLKMIRYLHDK
jgi:uncharacterized protein